MSHSHEAPQINRSNGEATITAKGLKFTLTKKLRSGGSYIIACSLVLEWKVATRVSLEKVVWE
jgi:hypothetical protein